MNMLAPSSPRLGDYRTKLTPGTTLGLSYSIYDAGYNVSRSLPVQQLTVMQLTVDGVVFHKQDGHTVRLNLDSVLTYLCFGLGPYLPQYNILIPPPADAPRPS